MRAGDVPAPAIHRGESGLSARALPWRDTIADGLAAMGADADRAGIVDAANAATGAPQ
jgi:hypothetical protein